MFVHLLAHEGGGGKINPLVLLPDGQAVNAFSQQSAVLVHLPLVLAEDGFAHVNRVLEDALHRGPLPEEAVTRRRHFPPLKLVSHFIQG